MRPWVASFVSLLFLSLVLIGTGWALAWRLAAEQRRSQNLRWLLAWSLKGLLLPLALWTVMNLGISWALQPFMPQVQAAQNRGGNWWPAFLRVAVAGMFIVSSYWTALTLGWGLMTARGGLVGEARSDFKALCWTCFLGMIVPALLVLLLGGWVTLGLAAIVLLAPIAAYAPAILRVKKLPPMYAAAIARMKFGKYSEAEWEIIRQLENCEDDFEGWLMLAELYAKHFNDLAEAEQTVLEICGQPKTTAPQLSIALHRLADWQLQLASDPDAARRALQIICDRLKGSHLARMAQLRINQLPRTSEELREQQVAQTVPLPALGDSLDEEPAPAGSEPDRDKAVKAANACVEKLKQDPNNVPAREKLARILVEGLQQVDQGLEQLGLLLDMPDQPEAKRAEWLGLTAAWHIKHRQDVATGRKVLERLLREFPQTPQAFAARRRLQLLDVPARG